MKCILADKNEVETVLDVYIRTKDSFYDVSEFIHALDVLYVLGLLNINNKTGLVEYA
ncbi:ABC-three component system middle component 7 [Methylotuvimicrobium buryatense]